MAKVKEMPKQAENAELSPEELAKRRQEITNFYKDNAKHLKVQLEYEKLLTDIEKARAERVQAQMFMAQAYAAQEKQNGQASEAEMDFESMKSAMEEAESNRRTLKREL